MPVPYSPPLEEFFLVGESEMLKAARFAVHLDFHRTLRTLEPERHRQGRALVSPFHLRCARRRIDRARDVLAVLLQRSRRINPTLGPVDREIPSTSDAALSKTACRNEQSDRDYRRTIRNISNLLENLTTARLDEVHSARSCLIFHSDLRLRGLTGSRSTGTVTTRP